MDCCPALRPTSRIMVIVFLLLGGMLNINLLFLLNLSLHSKLNVYPLPLSLGNHVKDRAHISNVEELKEDTKDTTEGRH